MSVSICLAQISLVNISTSSCNPLILSSPILHFCRNLDAIESFFLINIFSHCVIFFFNRRYYDAKQAPDTTPDLVTPIFGISQDY